MNLNYFMMIIGLVFLLTSCSQKGFFSISEIDSKQGDLSNFILFELEFETLGKYKRSIKDSRIKGYLSLEEDSITLIPLLLPENNLTPNIERKVKYKLGNDFIIPNLYSMWILRGKNRFVKKIIKKKDIIYRYRIGDSNDYIEYDFSTQKGFLCIRIHSLHGFKGYDDEMNPIGNLKYKMEVINFKN